VGLPTTSKILASWSALKFSWRTDEHLHPAPGSPRKGGLPGVRVEGSELRVQSEGLRVAYSLKLVG
jgi:hypothetical protein